MVVLSLFLDSLAPNPPMGEVWNEEKEMSELYVSLRGKIYAFLYKFTKNEDTAMDLLQDTFLSYFKSYGSSSLSREHAIPLLYRIARNCSINHSKKFSSVKEVKDKGIDFHPDSRSFESHLINQDLEERLKSCLNDMNDQEREAIILRYMEDLNLSQIATILEISISTASRLITKATTRLLCLAKERGIEWK